VLPGKAADDRGSAWLWRPAWLPCQERHPWAWIRFSLPSLPGAQANNVIHRWAISSDRRYGPIANTCLALKIVHSPAAVAWLA